MEKIPFDDPGEHLFIRVEEKHVVGKGVLPAVVKVPDWSSNRERLSSPDDVLDSVRYPEFTRVGEVVVGDVPFRIEPDPPEPNQKKAVAWLFWVEHDPEEGNDARSIERNDAHSEVRMRKDGEEYVRGKSPGSKYKKRVRSELAKIVRVR